MSCRDTDFQAGDPYEVVCMYVGCLRRWIGPGSLQFKTNAVSLAFRFTLVVYVCITKVLEEEGQKDAFNLQELCAVSIDFQQASRCPNLFQTSDVCNFGGSAVHRCWWSKCFSESRDDLRDLHGRVCVVLNVGFEMERTKAPPKMWMKSWIEVEQMFLHSLWIPDWSATYRHTELIGKYNLIRKRLLEEPVGVAFFGGLGKSDLHLFDSSWGRCWSWVSVPRLTFWFWVVWFLASRGRQGHHNVTLVCPNQMNRDD